MKIAFGYKMRSGKDIAVDYLIQKYGGEKITFAKPIYDILYYAQKVCNFELGKDREFLRLVANWAKAKDNDIWVKLALDGLLPIGNLYCTDLRFLNEYKTLKENGWICVKITRKEDLKSESDLDQSETELDLINDWDFVIANNGTIDEFQNELNKLVSKIIGYQ